MSTADSIIHLCATNAIYMVEIIDISISRIITHSAIERYKRSTVVVVNFHFSEDINFEIIRSYIFLVKYDTVYC